MRKITLLFLLAMAFCYLPAQFNITDTDIPQIGDKQFYQYVDTTNFTPGSAGTGQTWNFSSFADSSMPFYMEVIDPSSGPHSSQFANNSTIGIAQEAGNYTYYNLANGKLDITGVVNSLTLSAAAAYSDPGLRYNLPTVFNTTYTDSLSGTFTTPVGIAYRQGEVQTTVDADGSITLPNGTTTSGVIRVKHVSTIRDSANLFGNIVISNSTTTYYEWYASTQRLPLMVSYRVTGTAAGSPINEFLVYYAAQDTSVSVDHPRENIAFNISPNPFGQAARLSFSLETSSEIEADLIDLSGRVIQQLAEGNFGSGEHDLIVNGANLTPGVYFVRMRSEGAQVTRKLVHF